ncbi:MAG: thioredoxin family protein [Bacteroidota bacterium]
MKQIILLFLGLALVINIEAQDAGIQFSQTDWEQTLQMAKEQDKLIFVDAYTTWCGPCKRMAANVFPQEAVGALYNDHFINLKIDMEKGEGILFARAYGVQSYPTFLYINSRGQLMHKGLGSRDADEFIALGEAATDPDQQMASLTSRYNANERSPDFLRKYALTLGKVREPNADKVAQEYLASQSNWETPETMEFILESRPRSTKSELYQFLAKHRKQYHEMGKKGEVDYLLSSAIKKDVMTSKNFEKAHIVDSYQKVFGEDGVRLGEEFHLDYLGYRASDKDFTDTYMAAAVDFMDKYEGHDWASLNAIAWRFYELTDDSKMLLKAKKWAEQSIALDGNYANHDTMAAICFKLQEKETALKHARLAIDHASTTGEDAKETRALLEKINAL